jgi:putative transposase
LENLSYNDEPAISGRQSLEPAFTVAASHQVWVGDATYIRTMEGWLYLAILLNLYSRAVLRSAMVNRLTEELTQHVFQDVIDCVKLPPL